MSDGEAAGSGVVEMEDAQGEKETSIKQRALEVLGELVDEVHGKLQAGKVM